MNTKEAYDFYKIKAERARSTDARLAYKRIQAALLIHYEIPIVKERIQELLQDKTLPRIKRDIYKRALGELNI